ncbi:NADH:ubiquinone oxidoreductase subunit K [Deinococcus budaensis]|uniref:NADH:ubiquinone oxidoreductase subunit K n=1 Tax=Deinococcus budaensis TaxID=1665626 RepID=A0A7W8GG30_9DEIO|nr:hypothetical protein [Deinococcus budaensis]MBB5234689.1 NADH:ubiquinone oxidoreductase subunit K [Deinococcus budaensis]
MLTPVVIWWLFALGLAALSLLRPAAARYVLAAFMLVMSGVNVYVGVTDPGSYVTFGGSSPVPLYAWFFHSVVGLAPAAFVLALAVFEAGVGLALLGRTAWVRWGAVLGALFALAIVPLGVLTSGNLAFALALLLLLARPFSRSLLDVWTGARRHLPVA